MNKQVLLLLYNYILIYFLYFSKFYLINTFNIFIFNKILYIFII